MVVVVVVNLKDFKSNLIDQVEEASTKQLGESVYRNEEEGYLIT